MNVQTPTRSQQAAASVGLAIATPQGPSGPGPFADPHQFNDYTAITRFAANTAVPHRGNNLRDYSQFYLPSTGVMRVQEFLQYVGCLDPAQRAQTYTDILAGMYAQLTEQVYVMTAFTTYVQTDSEAMEAYGGLAQWREDHAYVKNIEEFKQKAYKQVVELQNRIIQKWGTAFRNEVILPFSSHIWVSETVLTRIEYLAKRLPIIEISPAVNMFFYQRQTHRGKGQSASKHVEGQDFMRVREWCGSLQKGFDAFRKRQNLPSGPVDCYQSDNQLEWRGVVYEKGYIHTKERTTWPYTGSGKHAIPEQWMKDNQYIIHPSTGLIIPRTIVKTDIQPDMSPIQARQTRIRSPSQSSAISMGHVITNENHLQSQLEIRA